MKRFFTLIAIVLGCITFSSCEKGIDPSDVEFEVAIEFLGYNQNNYREYVCYGSLGGFIGDATIIVNDKYIHDVKVTGAKTPYSFTFSGWWKYSYGTPPSFYNVKVLAGKKMLMETIVVPR